MLFYFKMEPVLVPVPHFCPEDRFHVKHLWLFRYTHSNQIVPDQLREMFQILFDDCCSGPIVDPLFSPEYILPVGAFHQSARNSCNQNDQNDQGSRTNGNGDNNFHVLFIISSFQLKLSASSAHCGQWSHQSGTLTFFTRSMGK